MAETQRIPDSEERRTEQKLNWESSDARISELLRAGEIEEAQAELSRTLLDSLDSVKSSAITSEDWDDLYFDQLAQEGMESGEPVEMTAESWRELRTEFRKMAGIE